MASLWATRVVRSLYHSRTARMMDGLERLLPPLRAWHRCAYQEHFQRLADYERMYTGVYQNFGEALRVIPSDRKIGYDNPECARFLGHKGSIFPNDYPILFWLERLIAGNPRVFDFGGYLGNAYHNYRERLDWPEKTDWLVCDVPAVVDAGRHLAAENGWHGLGFTTDFLAANGRDLLLASGSIQFLEDEFAERLLMLACPPLHLLINKLPAFEGEPFVTLQNMGPALTPYRVFNTDAFIRSIERAGYLLKDQWSNPDLGCYIPFHPEQTVRAFRGMYFILADHSP